jgi:hypothetical protein
LIVPSSGGWQGLVAGARNLRDLFFALPGVGRLFTFPLAGTPSPPDLLESWDWGLTTTKIFELEGLIRKIFQTNELAVSIIIFRLILQLQD